MKILREINVHLISRKISWSSIFPWIHFTDTSLIENWEFSFSSILLSTLRLQNPHRLILEDHIVFEKLILHFVILCLLRKIHECYFWKEESFLCEPEKFSQRNRTKNSQCRNLVKFALTQFGKNYVKVTFHWKITSLHTCFFFCENKWP